MTHDLASNVEPSAFNKNYFFEAVGRSRVRERAKDSVIVEYHVFLLRSVVYIVKSELNVALVPADEAIR